MTGAKPDRVTMFGETFTRGGGRVPFAVLAAENGQTVAEAKRSMAELAAAGVVRLVLGPEGEVPRIRVTGTLTLVEEGGKAGCYMLTLVQPEAALPPSRRWKLAAALSQQPGLSLGALALLCASMRLADNTGVATSAAIEDYTGLARGAISKRTGAARDLLRPPSPGSPRDRARSPSRARPAAGRPGAAPSPRNPGAVRHGPAGGIRPGAAGRLDPRDRKRALVTALLCSRSPLTLVFPKGCRQLSRREARVFTSIWKDEDFTALPSDAQWLYLFLLSQDDLTYCGVLPLRPGRWVRKAKGLTVASLREGLAVLAGGEHPFIVIDEETGELLVRSLIRRDGIWKMPNIMKAARESAESVESPAIRAVLLDELERIPAAESDSKPVREIHAQFISDLLGSSRNPSPNPSRMGFQDHAEEPAYPQDGPRGAVPQGKTTAPASPQARGPRNPSPNPSANPSWGNNPLPQSPIPFPPTPGEPARVSALLPAASASAKQGGGGIPDEKTPQAADALVAEVLAVRDDWSEDKIRAVFAHPKVARRPWPRVVTALLAVARDPKSDHPGRVTADGPWWRAAPQVPARPGWCGECDEPTRMREAADGRPYRCPECHPSAERARTA